MKYICITKHYKRRLWEKETIQEFDEDPGNHWEPMEKNLEPSFGSDPRHVLMEKDWKLSDLKDYMSDEFGTDIRGKISKEAAVDKLIYARENHIDPKAAVVAPEVQEE